MEQNKIFCDVCKEEMTSDDPKIRAEHIKLKNWSEFDVCKICFKEFKKWRKIQLNKR